MVDTVLAYYAYLKKFLIYVAGTASQLLAYGLVPAEHQAKVMAVVAILTGLGIYQADNADKPGDHSAG